MPPTTSTPHELIELDLHGGAGGNEPPVDRGDGGEGDRGRRPRKPPQSGYATAIKLGMASILMFFLVPSTLFIILEHTNKNWVPAHVPKILWLNTAILLASSYTMERARRRLSALELAGFRKLWRSTAILGIAFVGGQVIAWAQLVASGIYIANSQATSFFYIFSVAHAVHLSAGISALLYVNANEFEGGKISRVTAVEITSYYWHFMDALWVFLLLLLYFGK